jgi:hypothetical protein
MATQLLIFTKINCIVHVQKVLLWDLDYTSRKPFEKDWIWQDLEILSNHI